MLHKQALSALLLFCSLALSSVAQQTTPVATPSNYVVPMLSRFSGTLKDLNGKPVSDITGVTFALYKDAEGGAPLWLETQSVRPDQAGHYSVTLGATASEGLPADLFASGEARWLGVQISGQAENPRVLLLSVPYALKAQDAETIGGLPPSAFVLANGLLAKTSQGTTTTTTLSAPKTTLPSAQPAITGSGSANYIPIWNSTSDIVNSIMYQNNGQMGINTTSPAATLDVFGTALIHGTLTLAPGTSPAPALALVGSAFKVNKLGVVTFAPGQTFPGTGTITGVTAGTGLTGGGTSGSVTLNVDTTKLPLLNGANTFNGSQNVTGNVSATGNLQVDSGGTNTGQALPGIQFGASNSGETISSKRSSGGNQYGLDFYTAYTARMSLSNNGRVGIGTQTPAYTLDVSNGDAIVRGSGNFQQPGDIANLYIGDMYHQIQATRGPSSGGLRFGTYLAPFQLFLAERTGNIGIGTITPSRILEVAQGLGHPRADGWDTYSSRRWKDNIHTLQGALEKVEQLRGVSYDLKGFGKHEIGVIAEEVGAVVPEVVSWEADGKSAESVDYGRLTALLIEATKEQQKLIHSQQRQIAAQQTRMKVQDSKIAKLTSEMRTVQTTLKSVSQTQAARYPSTELAMTRH